MKNIFKSALLTLAAQMGVAANAAELKVNDAAPLFTALTQAGKTFDLKSRAGHWTVLYFYPKANTPGCTKQACAFRDNIKKIQAEGAEVYGISTDDVAAQAAFHKEHHLTFDLLADPKAEITELYGVKMPIVNIAKRWTFIINPDLKISKITKDVDPIIDSQKMAEEIAALKKQRSS